MDWNLFNYLLYFLQYTYISWYANQMFNKYSKILTLLQKYFSRFTICTRIYEISNKIITSIAHIVCWAACHAVRNTLYIQFCVRKPYITHATQKYKLIWKAWPICLLHSYLLRIEITQCISNKNEDMWGNIIESILRPPSF